MKKILLSICIFAFINSNAQDFDDVKYRYEHDSDFTMKVDENYHDYVDIEHINVFGNTYTRLYSIYWKNFGTQPYQIFPSRDSIIHLSEAINGLDTAIISLDPVICKTKSGSCFFTIIGSNGNKDESISINNINSNAYYASEKYGWKFRFWYFADIFGITLK